MKSIYYITLLIGAGCLGLAGCAEAPIARTNCWTGAISTVTRSTMGASPDAAPVSRAASSPAAPVTAAPSTADVLPCR